MEGILPVEIQWRKDKTMYSPDFIRRLIDDREEFYEKIRVVQQELPEMTKYIDFERLRANLQELEVNPDWNSFNDRSLTVVGMGFMAINFLEYLNEKYNLDF